MRRHRGLGHLFRQDRDLIRLLLDTLTQHPSAHHCLSTRVLDSGHFHVTPSDPTESSLLDLPADPLTKGRQMQHMLHATIMAQAEKFSSLWFTKKRKPSLRHRKNIQPCDDSAIQTADKEFGKNEIHPWGPQVDKPARPVNTWPPISKKAKIFATTPAHRIPRFARGACEATN